MGNFNKKYNPSEREAQIQKFWEENKIFKFDKMSSKPIFSIDTPPPTISGKMHVGHAFSYTQSDFIARFKRMMGFNVYYPFGTDDNGLATENLVEKEKKINLRTVERNEAIKIVNNYLEEIRPEFISDWKKLGISCDFSLSYSTIGDHSRKTSQKTFLELQKLGLIERRKGPIMWDTRFQTAVAQAELEVLERKSYLNYIKAKVIGSKNTYLIYATTRPELCFAFVGMSIEDEGVYVKLKVGEEFWICGKTTYEVKFSDFDFKVVEELTGENLIGDKVKIPLVDREVEISQDIAVKANFGTGIAYFCSFGGQEDIEWIARHGKNPISILEKNGKLNSLAGKYVGKSTTIARAEIIDDLEKSGELIKKEEITQTVNICERGGKEVEFIVSEQWYVKYLDKKEYFLEMAQKFNWNPKFMKHRLENWICGLNWDWGFSRQRNFGVPIPVWYGKKSGKQYFPKESQLPIDPITEKPILKKRIVFLRHGESEANLLKITNNDPSKKFALTEKGVLQAKAVGKEFKGFSFDRVITSDLLRCNLTAKNVLSEMKVNKIPIEEDLRLREMEITPDGSDYKTNRKIIKKELLKKEAGAVYAKKKEIENLILEMKKCDSQNILVVTHKDLIRLLMIIKGEKTLEEFYDLNPDNCAIVEFEFDFEPNEELIGETDIFDTWFTSSSTPMIASTLLGDDFAKKLYPMDLRPQAHDIISFWLFYSMAKANLLTNENPFENVMISGWVLDPKGKKMSKSKGNTIAPQDIVSKYSNDGLRFAAGSTKLGQDIPFQEKEVQTGVKLVNKIYNATKFADILLKNFKVEDKEILDTSNLKSIDRWILAKTQISIKNATKYFNEFEYSKAKTEFETLFMKDIADNYIEIVKERLWKPEVYGMAETLKAQKTLYNSLFTVIRGLSPFVPFICEEVYQNFFSKFENEKSIHLSNWPKDSKNFENEKEVELGDKFVAIIGAVRKFKSEKQVSMKTPLKSLKVECSKELEEFISLSIEDLKSVTKALKVEFGSGEISTDFNDVKVKIEVK